MNKRRQITNQILMVHPASFGFNPETADNNAFQNSHTNLSLAGIQQLAVQEFDDMVQKLRAMGIKVLAIEDSKEPRTTDAVFPNNWFSTHEKGQLILYPMYSPMRRLERRSDIIDRLTSEYGYEVNDDLLPVEAEGK